MSGAGHDSSLEGKVRRLESDKESLMLQVSVLTDQVEAQGDKISDLLKSMHDSKGKLKTTERMLRSVSTRYRCQHAPGMGYLLLLPLLMLMLSSSDQFSL